MNLAYKHLVPKDFDDNSRVWVYQSNRLFHLGEALEIETLLENFIGDWKTHGTPVKGFASLFFGQFIVLMADESIAQVSGCSTDSSVRLIKSIEERFKVNLFDRISLAFVVNQKIQVLPMSQIEYALEKSFITSDTLFFDNTVANKHDLLNKWIIPVSTSWISKRYNRFASNAER